MQLYSQWGRWYVFAYVYDPVQDRRKRVKRSTGILDDGTRSARERAALVGAEIERNLTVRRVRGPSTTLKEVFEELVRSRELARQNAERTLYAAKAFFDVLGPDTIAGQLDSAALRRYAQFRMVTVDSNTVRREFAELRRGLNLSKIPVPEFPKLPAARPRERWLTSDECVRLLEATPEHRKNLIMAYLQCGLRRSEAYKLELLPASEMRVHGTKSAGANRLMPLTDLASEAVRYGFTEWKNGNRDLKRYAKRAGIGPITFNDLRRTFATHLARAGVPILHLMALMGHKSTRMLEQVYARVEAGKHLHDAVARLPWTNAGQLEPLLPAKTAKEQDEKDK